jgi:hypothetical protein
MHTINGKPIVETDDFIDIETLKSLEIDIVKGICKSEHIMATYGPNTLGGRPNFYNTHMNNIPSDEEMLSLYKELEKPHEKRLFTKLMYGVYSGGTTVTLRTTEMYTQKNIASSNINTKNYNLFPSLTDYIHNILPFQSVGRILIFVNDHDLITPIHTDGFVLDAHRNEFLWLRTNKRKQFFVYNEKTQEKHYVKGHSAFFNEQCYHGTEISNRMNFSIRIDGVFTNKFREQLGIEYIENYNENCV